MATKNDTPCLKIDAFVAEMITDIEEAIVECPIPVITEIEVYLDETTPTYVVGVNIVGKSEDEEEWIELISDGLEYEIPFDDEWDSPILEAFNEKYDTNFEWGDTMELPHLLLFDEYGENLDSMVKGIKKSKKKKFSKLELTFGDHDCMYEKGDFTNSIARVLRPMKSKLLKATLDLFYSENKSKKRMKKIAKSVDSSPENITRLVENLKDPDDYNSESDLLSVGSAIIPFLAAPLQSEDAALRKRVASMFYYSIKDTAGEELLLPLLEDPEQAVRSMSANALGVCGTGKSVGPLTALLNDSISNVRYCAVTALGAIGSKSALPALLPVLQDENWNHRGNAAEAIVNIGDPRALEHLLPLLTEKAPADSRGRSQYERVRSNLPLLLAKLHNHEAVPHLVTFAQNLRASEKKEYGTNLVTALGELGSELGLPVIYPYLSSMYPTVQRPAIEAIGKIASPDSAEFLFPLLASEDNYRIQSAAIALGKLNNPAALPALESALQWIEDQIENNYGFEETREDILKTITLLS